MRMFRRLSMVVAGKLSATTPMVVAGKLSATTPMVVAGKLSATTLYGRRGETQRHDSLWSSRQV